VVEPGEECDDGNPTDGDGCSSFCTLETPQSEICDNGMDDDMDGLVDCADMDCDSDPACAPVCGNGVVEPTSGEECDIDDFGGETCQSRGYASGTLTCTPSCTIDDGGCTPFDCGDGILSPGEECDDGNNTDGDGCSSDCTIEPPPEICEDRVDNDGDGLVDCADPDCASDPFCLCGNGIIEGNEECDDGNNTDGDGCSSSCTLESPQSEICDNGMDDDMDGLVDCLDSDCANDPACGPSCGNGFLEPGEACDDGNRDNTDSCPDDPSTGGTCQPAACGDGHLYQGVEECDTTDLDGETCQSLGYNSGTLTCGATCTFDTSNCQ
jgi:cysteine-rich repeat protein